MLKYLFNNFLININYFYNYETKSKRNVYSILNPFGNTMKCTLCKGYYLRQKKKKKLQRISYSYSPSSKCHYEVLEYRKEFKTFQLRRCCALHITSTQIMLLINLRISKETDNELY